MLDSNVLVAALRSRRGASFELISQLRRGRFEIAISVPLAFEYEATLVRHAEALALSRSEATALVDFACSIAHKQEIHFLWRPSLTDPGDEFVLELAVNSRAAGIVTFNGRDFAGAERFGIRIVTPAEFLEWLEEEK